MIYCACGSYPFMFTLQSHEKLIFMGENLWHFDLDSMNCEGVQSNNRLNAFEKDSTVS